MKVHKLLILVITVVLIISGCATHISSIRDSNESGLFIGDEFLLFQLSYQAMEKAYPSCQIVDDDGPIRGFVVSRTFGPDNYNTLLRIFPAIGVDKDNKEVFGYYFEVSGGGTLFDGPGKDKKVYDYLLNELNQNFKYIPVNRIIRSEYKIERDRWKLSRSKYNLTNEKTKEEKLIELKSLFDKGLISKEEYNISRQKILFDKY